MPKVKQIGTNTYQYLCECGAEVILFQDFPLKKAVKCFHCIKKEETKRGKKDATTTDERL